MVDGVMLLVERHHTKGSPEIVRLCSLSKELYNRCNYLVRKAWFAKQKLPNISRLVNDVKEVDCFKQLHNTKTAKQTIRKVLADWSTFFKSLAAYRKDKTRFTGNPRPPKYKTKLAQVVFYNETIKGGQNGRPLEKMTATNGCFSLPYRENYKRVVVTPKTFGFIITVEYEAEDRIKPALDKSKIATIDIGLNCLAAITYGQNRPVLVNGRIVKSINQWYNKHPCRTRLRKRYFRLENYFHHVSKYVVDLCLRHNIGRIIIGKNNGWKQGINLGKKTNQAFCFVPVDVLLQKIRYKAEAVGVDVVFTEESYTSKASFFDHDKLPKYGESEVYFSGRRKHRGLYVSGDGFAVNADVNGSLNIGRKVIPEFSGIWDRSLAARPIAINPLKI